MPRFMVAILAALLLAACASPAPSGTDGDGLTTSSLPASPTSTSIPAPSTNLDPSGPDVIAIADVWINQVGLRQTDESIWRDRITEICATDESDFATLGRRYAEEDAELSVRDGGSVPEDGELVDSLYVIRSQACVDGPGQADVPTVGAHVFDVDGVEVVAVTESGALPDRATAVQFTTLIIDAGGGPVLCLGGVAESLPPQCSGPIVDGLDTDGWTDESQGVRWGGRTVDVTWPPVDGHVQLINSTEETYVEVVDPTRQLPAQCASERTQPRYAGATELHEYANTLGGRLAGIWLAEDDRLVLQVTDDPEPHRAAFEDAGAELCVVKVDRSEQELRDIIDEASDIFSSGLIVSVGFPSADGRIHVQVAVVDRHTVDLIRDYFPEGAPLRISGQAFILES